MTGIEKLKSGNFETMIQEKTDNGIKVTLSSSKYKTPNVFIIKDLYLPTEEVLEVISGD